MHGRLNIMVSIPTYAWHLLVNYHHTVTRQKVYCYTYLLAIHSEAAPANDERNQHVLEACVSNFSSSMLLKNSCWKINNIESFCF